MYFRNYGPRNRCLDKCLKPPVWENPLTGNMVSRSKHLFNLKKRAPLSSWVITAKVMEFQKSLLQTWKFFSRFFNTLTTGYKYSLVSRDNRMETIQTHLSQKQNVFSGFFAAFFEFALNFEHFQKKMNFIAYVFPKLPTTKHVLR